MRKGKRRTLPGLADWIEANVELPQGLAAEPGRVKLWPWQRAIADAISDPALERVTLLKPTRVGFTCLLTSAIAYYVVRDPAPILVLLPTEADCRDFLVSDVEPLFERHRNCKGDRRLRSISAGVGSPASMSAATNCNAN
jgi:phage terminase large subunit GpA-like protein